MPRLFAFTTLGVFALRYGAKPVATELEPPCIRSGIDQA